MCGISKLPATALYFACKTVNIKNFDNKTAFIKGSFVLNGCASMGLFGLVHLINKFDNGSLLGKYTNTQSVITVLAFGIFNSLWGGSMAFYAEMNSRADLESEQSLFNLNNHILSDTNMLKCAQRIIHNNILSAAIPTIAFLVYKRFK